MLVHRTVRAKPARTHIQELEADAPLSLPTESFVAGADTAVNSQHLDVPSCICWGSKSARIRRTPFNVCARRSPVGLGTCKDEWVGAGIDERP